MPRRKEPHPLAVLGGIVAGTVVFGGILSLVFGDKGREEEQRRVEQRQREAAANADAELKVCAFAQKTLKDVCSLFRIPCPPLYFGEDVPNFASDGHRIGVNPKWARDVIEKHCASHACNRDVLRWFIAHEVGHHVAGDALAPTWIGSEKLQRHVQELRADYFAGFALAHLDGEIAHLDSVLRTHASIETHTHPDFTKRIRAAREGFLVAGSAAEA